MFNSFIVLIGLAFALGCDAFAVGLAVGTTLPGKRASFRLWFHFGLFQFLMPIIGWTIGVTLIPYNKDYDHWVVFALLAAIAAKMLLESFESNGGKSASTSETITRGWSLVMLSFATSFDALGVGVSMGITGDRPFLPSVLIGIVAGFMTYGGLKLGKGLSLRFGKRVERLGAVILFIIAFELLSI